MRISVDTNVLARAILQDDPAQCQAARQALREATLIAISLPCLCELAWILQRGARLPKQEIASAIRTLLGVATVVMNRPAVEAGLAVLEAGGDFADGVMAHEGKTLGGETFVSFDRKAVSLLTELGEATRLMS